MVLRKTLLLLLAFVLSQVVSPQSALISIAQTEKPEFISLNQTRKASSLQRNYFTENKGQWNSDILFAGTTPFGNIAFACDSIYFQLVKEEIHQVGEKNVMTYASNFYKLPLIDSPTLHLEERGILPHCNHYFIGNDLSKWASHCRNYSEIRYTDIDYELDLRFFYNSKGLAYEYSAESNSQWEELQPFEADVSSFKRKALLPFELNLTLGSKSFFRSEEKLDLSNLSPQTEALIYSSYMGESAQDYAYGITLDAQKNAIITGASYSTNFPITPGAYEGNHPTGQNVFVTKFNSNGSGLLFSTYFGGSGIDVSRGIALDNIGNMYITGETQSSDLPITPEAYQKDFKGVNDGFVIKLNTSGSSLLYSTYLGGMFSDGANALAVDDDYNAYIAGVTMSPDFPVTSEAYQTKNKANNAFIAKMNPNGSTLLYSTFLGGSVQDQAISIAVDKNACAYVTGRTMSKDFPITSGGYQVEHKGNTDAFVTKLNSIGNKLLYSTFLGGSQNDIPSGITIDNTQNIYITGKTQSIDFPVTPKAFQMRNNGSFDSFVVKLNVGKDTLLYSTYFGGSDQDSSTCIAIDNAGDVYIAGETLSNDFPTTTGAYQNIKNLGYDIFISKLAPDGSGMVYSTYLGGTGGDVARSIAIDNIGNAYITGETQSKDFPITSGAYQKSHHGGACDAFMSVMKPITSDMNNGKVTILLKIGSKNAYVNNQLVVLDVAPFIDRGRTFVPFRFVGESLGAQVGYTTDSSGRVATVTYQLGSISITLYIGKKNATVNGRTVTMDVAPQILQGRTVVPLRFVTENLGCKVDWDGEKMEILITFPA